MVDFGLHKQCGYWLARSLMKSRGVLPRRGKERPRSIMMMMMTMMIVRNVNIDMNTSVDENGPLCCNIEYVLICDVVSTVVCWVAILAIPYLSRNRQMQLLAR